MKIRTFIALELENNILDKIIEMRDKLNGSNNSVKWEPRNKLHITLKFLGDTNTEIIDELCTKLKNKISDTNSFFLESTKFGLFKNISEPKILWFGFRESEELLKLVNDIEEISEAFGFERERRKFKSHLTLLRIKDYQAPLDYENILNYQPEHLKFRAEKISLIESTLQKSGSIYKTNTSFYLKK